MSEAVQRVEDTAKFTILAQYDAKIRLYQSFTSEVEHLVRSLIDSCQISYNSIGSRVKDRYSLSEKIDRKNGKYSALEDITDIAGVRVITYYSEDVDRVASLIEKEFDIDRPNSIDKRAALEPDKFGYCSVHYVVKMRQDRLALREFQSYEGLCCEIQIRSVLQHAWAEIEHDTGYKSELTLPRELRRSFSRIAGLLEIADKEFDNIRRELSEYKKTAEQKIEQTVAKDGTVSEDGDQFLNREIDSIIIQVVVDADPDIQQLNKHIANLRRESLEERLDPSDAARLISKLNWLGIMNVGDLIAAIQEYQELALDIAKEVLKNYEPRCKGGSVDRGAALFFLCYAVLVAEKRSKKEIVRYLRENHIGSHVGREEFAERLLSISSEALSK